MKTIKLNNKLNIILFKENQSYDQIHLLKIKTSEVFIILTSGKLLIFLLIKSDKPNSKIRFPMLCLPHNDMYFFAQIYNKKNMRLQNF